MNEIIHETKVGVVKNRRRPEYEKNTPQTLWRIWGDRDGSDDSDEAVANAQKNLKICRSL